MDANINNNPDDFIYDSQDTYMLDRPFVFTQDKNLVTGMPYMLLEGNQTKAVRLGKIWQEDHIIYLDVQELKSSKTFSLSWNLDYRGSYYLWTIADYQTLSNQTK